MGLIAVGLGPQDQMILRTLEPEVLAVLRKAASLTKTFKCRPQSRMWFGDNTDVWMMSLGTSLDRLASILNTKPIQVMGTNWQDRDTGTSAAARAPRGGWNTYTDMTGAQDRNFRIRVDIAWNTKPTFRPGNTPGLSKFHTIVHELTHLVLNTDDVSPAYGETNCKNKADNNPAAAKKNADNWAFFVDDMRNPVLAPVVAAVTSGEWREKTARNAPHTRSGDLSRLDRALAAYERQVNPANRRELVDAFANWYSRNPQERTARNVGTVVDRLKSYVESL